MSQVPPVGGSSGGWQQVAVVSGPQHGPCLAQREHLTPAPEGGEVQTGQCRLVALVLTPEDYPQAATLNSLDVGVLLFGEAGMPHRGCVL